MLVLYFELRLELDEVVIQGFLEFFQVFFSVRG